MPLYENQLHILVMKKPIFLLAGLCAIVLNRAAWGADTYKIDPVHSSVGSAVSPGDSRAKEYVTPAVS